MQLPHLRQRADDDVHSEYSHGKYSHSKYSHSKYSTLGSALMTTVRRAARVGAPNSSRGRAKNPSSARPPRTHTQGHLVRARMRVGARVRVRVRVRARTGVRVRVGARLRVGVRVSYRVSGQGQACRSLLEEERPAAG